MNTNYVFTGFQDCLQPLSMQALPDSAESLCIVEMGGKEGSEETRQGGGLAGLFLNIGLEVWRCKFLEVNISTWRLLI